MTADDTSGPADASDASDAGPTLEQARRRCADLLDALRRDAQTLNRPSRHVPPDALAEGRDAYDRAAAAAEALLQRLADQP